MEKILATAERSQQEELQIERALKLGATTTMIQSFFGLSPEDTAIKRLIMEIQPRRGRWRQLDGTLEHQIWYRWDHLMQENQVSLDDSLALLDIAMILTEEINAGTDQDSPEFISLAVVWWLIQSWLKDGLYSSDKSGQAQASHPRSPTTLYLA
ncbi:STY4526/YPO1902 family pathogenicity island replication protein, partial [Streptococcus pneumoniae]